MPRRSGIFGAFAAAAGAAGAVGALYLRPFVVHPGWPPFGFDPYGYAWRASVVAADGIRAIPGVPDRPAHPVLVDLLAAANGASPLAVMRTMPAILAAATALAAGGTAAAALGLGTLEAGLLAFAVGASAFVARTAVGYSANLAIDPLLLASVGLGVPAAVEGGPGALAGACALLASAFLYHWPLAALFAAVLAVGALGIRLPWRRRPAPELGTAAWRLLGVAAVGGTLGVGLLLVAMPRLPRHLPGAMVGRIPHLSTFVAARMPPLALPLTSAVALAGAVSLARRPGTLPRASARVLGAWAAVGVLGASAWYLLHIPTPPYRWAIFALPVPLLAAAAPIGLLAGTRATPVRRTAAILLAATAALWLASRGAALWWTLRPPRSPALYRELDAVASYARSLDPRTRLVLLTGRPRRGPILAGLPPRVAHRVLLRRPRRHRPLRPPRMEAVLVLHELAPRWTVPLRRAVALAPGVRLLRGPAPRRSLNAGRPFPGAAATAIGAAADLGLLWVLGSGWAWAVEPDAATVVWLSPAFGLAAVASLGSVAARAGLVPAGAAAPALLVGIAWAGLLAALARHAGRRGCKLGPSDHRPGEVRRCSRWARLLGRSRSAAPSRTSASSSDSGWSGSGASVS